MNEVSFNAPLLKELRMIAVLQEAAALIAAAFAREPLLAHRTQTFMAGAAPFLAKLMDDSGSVSVIARFMTERLGAARAVLAVVLAGAMVTYGGVSLFVAIFVIVPMAQGLFKAADISPRLMPAAVALGTMTFTMSTLPGTPALQNAIPMPFFGTTPFAAPGLGLIAAAVMLGFGLWWLGRAEAVARARGEGYSGGDTAAAVTQQPEVCERAVIASQFDPAEIEHSTHATTTQAYLLRCFRSSWSSPSISR
jgi:H+/gluconate symporter-like permease